MNFVVIGGDAAGMSAASKARRNHADLNITVLEQTHDVSYSACGMPYNIAAPEREMDDLVVRKAEVFKSKQNIDLRLGRRAVSIDPGARIVQHQGISGDVEETAYDRLLIATGARPMLPDIPGSNLAGVLALKSLEDGRSIKGFLAKNNVRKVVIVGMGYIGLEMAEAFYERGIQVDMIKPSKRFIPYLPTEMADAVSSELTQKGIGLHFGTPLRSIESDQSRLRLITDSGEMEADMILLSVGVIPNSEIAANAGISLGPKSSIAVDKALRTSDPNIFAAGDCADAFHIVTGKRFWIPLALRANRAGWAVADNLIETKAQLPGIAGTAVFKVLDMEVARTGLSIDEALKDGFDAVDEVIKSRSRAHTHKGNQTILVQLVADRKTGKLLGGSMVGREGCAHRINSLAVALQAGMRLDEFFQSDMAYAPPFSPVWDPLLTAANQLMKRM